MEKITQDLASHRSVQRLAVNFDYPVVFSRRVFDPANPALTEVLRRQEPERRHRVMVFVDSGVTQAFPDLIAQIETFFEANEAVLEMVAPPRRVLAGEAAKADFRLVEEWVREAFAHRLCRHSFFLAVGGGAVLDAVGFAAALIHRGIRMVRVPTTVLAQNDAGVGVKNGINWDLGKNALGVFAAPFGVVNDFAFLSGLPQDDWIGGVAEAYKVAILKDAAFLDFLCAEADALRERRAEPMEELIVRCAELHLQHIRASGDPFEMGEARPLDFGHWSAHCLERLSSYRIHHGQAVAAGLAIDCGYAREMGWLSEKDFDRVFDGLRRTGFTLWYPEFDDRDAEGARRIFEGLEDFREHLGGRLTLTFPDGVGNRREENEADIEVFEKIFEELHECCRDWGA